MGVASSQCVSRSEDIYALPVLGTVEVGGDYYVGCSSTYRGMEGIPGTEAEHLAQLFSRAADPAQSTMLESNDLRAMSLLLLRRCNDAKAAHLLFRIRELNPNFYQQ